MKPKIKKNIVLLMSIMSSFIILGGMVDLVLVSAQETGGKQYTLLAPLPFANEKGQVTIDTYIPGVFNLAIGIAGVLAVLMIIIGGVEYITTDAIQGKTDGKARIQNALWGLLLALVSYILLHTINPKLTMFDLNVKTTTIQNNNLDVDNPDNNPYVNKGKPTTEFEQPNNSSINWELSKQKSDSSVSDNIFMHPVE